MVANRPYHTINTWYVPPGRRAAELCLWMQSTGWWSLGQLDAVYEKSVSVVINISPLMCHHVECEHSGGWLKCRGLAGTICLYIHMRCTCLPRWAFMCVFIFLIWCFDYVSFAAAWTCFHFFIPRPTLGSAHAQPFSCCLSCFHGIMYWRSFIVCQACILAIHLCYYARAISAVPQALYIKLQLWDILSLCVEILHILHCQCFVVICVPYPSCCV